MFILDVTINPTSQNPQAAVPAGQGQQNPQGQGAQNTEQQRQEAQRLLQELNDRVTVLGDRIRGTQRNIERTEREMPGRFNIFAGGVRRGMQQSIEADRRYLSRLQSERNTQVEVQSRINRLMQEGKYEEATAIMQGREQEYRQRILQAGRQAIRETQAANQTLADADRTLANVETGLRVAQRGTVIAGAVVATVATGGAGAPLLVTAVAGTAAGTGIGALTNFTEAAGHVAHGNMSAGDAFSRAAQQTGRDALTSAQIGISGGVGMAAGRAVIGTAGAQVAPTLTRVVVSGMVGGGSGGFTGSVLQTGTNVALGEERRSVLEIARDTVIQTGIGTISGGLGARGQAALNQTVANGGTNSLARTLLIRGTTEVAAPTALTLGTYYAVHGQIDPSQATQDVAMNVLSSMVGARINQNHQNGTYGSNWRQNLRQEFQTPTFNSMGSSIGRLFARQTPPAVSTNGQPGRVTVPSEIQNSQSYRSATRDGRAVEFVVDDNLPSGTRAQAEVVEQNGARTQRIRISRDLAESLQSNSNVARRVLSEEIDHLNQSMIDPRRNGTVMPEPEYNARRAFQEITAESSSSSRFGGPRRGEILRQMRQKMDAGDFEGALALARQNGLSNADIANFRADYEHNINPSRTGLRQRSSNTSTVEDFVRIAENFEDLQTVRQFAEGEGINGEQFNPFAQRRINQWIENSEFHNFGRLTNGGRALAEEFGMNGDIFSNGVRDRARQLAVQRLESGRTLTPAEEAILHDLGLRNWLSRARTRIERRSTPTVEDIPGGARLERVPAENRLAQRGMVEDPQVTSEFGGLLHGQTAWRLPGSNEYWVWDNTGHTNAQPGPTYKAFVRNGNRFDRVGTFDSNFRRLRD